jgi:hypothetical protein
MEVTLPMRLAVHAAPDDPSVAAVSYGPVVLAGPYGGEAGSAMPEPDVRPVTRVSRRPLVFQARA